LRKVIVQSHAADENTRRAAPAAPCSLLTAELPCHRPADSPPARRTLTAKGSVVRIFYFSPAALPLGEQRRPLH